MRSERWSACPPDSSPPCGGSSTPGSRWSRRSPGGDAAGGPEMVSRRETVAVKESAGLPQPRRSGPWSVEGALAERRSVREYAGAPLTRADLGQLLWAAQGITGAEDLRTAPSAGA